MTYQGIAPTTPASTQETAGDAASHPLHCQWCAMSLQPGVTTCPSCGSRSIPDSRMIVPGTEHAAQTTAESIVTSPEIAVPAVEQSRESDSSLPPLPKLSYLEMEDRQLQTYGVIIVSVIVCVALGWLAGPTLSGPMEALTGTPVENTADLRPTGGFLGLLAGFLIGATGGWAIWSGR